MNGDVYLLCLHIATIHGDWLNNNNNKMYEKSTDTGKCTHCVCGVASNVDTECERENASKLEKETMRHIYALSTQNLRRTFCFNGFLLCVANYLCDLVHLLILLIGSYFPYICCSIFQFCVFVAFFFYLSWFCFCGTANVCGACGDSCRTKETLWNSGIGRMEFRNHQ